MKKIVCAVFSILSVAAIFVGFALSVLMQDVVSQKETVTTGFSGWNILNNFTDSIQGYSLFKIMTIILFVIAGFVLFLAILQIVDYVCKWNNEKITLCNVVFITIMIICVLILTISCKMMSKSQTEVVESFSFVWYMGGGNWLMIGTTVVAFVTNMLLYIIELFKAIDVRQEAKEKEIKETRIIKKEPSKLSDIKAKNKQTNSVKSKGKSATKKANKTTSTKSKTKSTK